MQPTLSPMHAAPAPPPPAAGEPIATDVLVIGGGPAGSAAATLLARRGWRVTLLEKAAHPRFHIGESLLPMNMPILERLGVLERVRAIGVLKLGADFPLDDGRYNTFSFKRALGARCDYAFQVRREEFDELLFRHAQDCGVDARERVTAGRVDFDDDDGRPHRVHARGADGAPLVFAPRFVVDASGRDTVIGSQLRLKQRNARHQSAAVFSHFTGVERRAGESAGNVTIIRHDHGWIWMIPLRDGVTSIGAVCSPGYLKQRQGDTESFLMRTLLETPAAAARMQDAERCAPVHVTGNYAYECTRMSGPGWVLLGDAWAFVDPMFSSGVFLAMNSAELGAAAIDAALRAPSSERAVMARLERHLARGLSEFKWFIYRFTSPTMKRLFARPRNDLQVEQAVVAMLAGDVFDHRAVRWRLRVFRAIYALTALRHASQAWLDRRRRRAHARVAFSDETLQADTAGAMEHA